MRRNVCLKLVHCHFYPDLSEIRLYSDWCHFFFLLLLYIFVILFLHQVKQLFHVSMTTRDSMSRLVKPASQSDLQERTKQAMSLYSDQLIAIVLPYYFTTLRLDHLRGPQQS